VSDRDPPMSPVLAGLASPIPRWGDRQRLQLHSCPPVRPGSARHAASGRRCDERWRSQRSIPDRQTGSAPFGEGRQHEDEDELPGLLPIIAGLGHPSTPLLISPRWRLWQSKARRLLAPVHPDQFLSVLFTQLETRFAAALPTPANAVDQPGLRRTILSMRRTMPTARATTPTAKSPIESAPRPVPTPRQPRKTRTNPRFLHQKHHTVNSACGHDEPPVRWAFRGSDAIVLAGRFVRQSRFESELTSKFARDSCACKPRRCPQEPAQCAALPLPGRRKT
jgi:hypothetical protein